MGYKLETKRAQGSFTVEAALIMPVILGISVLFIYITLFFFDRCTIEHIVSMACLDLAYENDAGSAEDMINAAFNEKLMLDWDLATDIHEDGLSYHVRVEACPELFSKRFVHSSYALKHFCPKY